jgi:uncharacterized protein (TIGR02246 family)
MNDLAELTTFAKRYAEAWCSQNPESVAAFFAENGSLSVNDGPPAVGRAAIAEVARGFMTDLSRHSRDDGQGNARFRRNEVPLDIHWYKHWAWRNR